MKSKKLSLTKNGLTNAAATDALNAQTKGKK